MVAPAALVVWVPVVWPPAAAACVVVVVAGVVVVVGFVGTSVAEQTEAYHVAICVKSEPEQTLPQTAEGSLLSAVR